MCTQKADLISYFAPQLLIHAMVGIVHLTDKVVNHAEKEKHLSIGSEWRGTSPKGQSPL